MKRQAMQPGDCANATAILNGLSGWEARLKERGRISKPSGSIGKPLILVTIRRRYWGWHELQQTRNGWMKRRATSSQRSISKRQLDQTVEMPWSFFIPSSISWLYSKLLGRTAQPGSQLFLPGPRQKL